MHPKPSSEDPLARLLALRDKPERLVCGLMSGTSADGIDVALVRLRGHGAALDFELVHFEVVPFAPQIKRRIWGLPDATTGAICELDVLLGQAFGGAVVRACESAQIELAELDLVGSHGQTARHHPRGIPGRVPSTLQIGALAEIAERCGAPVIGDFRSADVAAGGHGAPLIPRVDQLLFHPAAPAPRGTGGARGQVLLNLGGIANVTRVTADASTALAFDTGPANMALDAVARAASGGHLGYDRDGELAADGQVDERLLDELCALPYFAATPPKSTGRELFGRDFTYPLLDRYAARKDGLANLAATLTELTAVTVARAIERWLLPGHDLARVLASGGGVHNPRLMERLASHLGAIGLPLHSLAEVGVDPDAKEALGFAILANETLFGRPGNVPSATGARGPRVLGQIALS